MLTSQFFPQLALLTPRSRFLHLPLGFNVYATCEDITRVHRFGVNKPVSFHPQIVWVYQKLSENFIFFSDLNVLSMIGFTLFGYGFHSSSFTLRRRNPCACGELCFLINLYKKKNIFYKNQQDNIKNSHINLDSLLILRPSP